MEIPFKIGQGSGHPHVPVYVNGKGPYTFTLDTGAVTTTISPKIAEDLGISIYDGDKAFASGVGGGKVEVKFAKLESFQVGSEKVENEEVLVIDFDSVLGCFTSGVIGHSFLKNFKLHLNYTTNKMLLEKSDEPENGGIWWEDFQYAEDTHLVTVPSFVNGEGPFNLVVDTGSGGTVITPGLADRLGLSNESKIGDIQVKSLTSESESGESDGCANGCQGVGGFAPGYAVQAAEFRAGSKTQVNPILAVIDLNVVSPRGLVIHDGIIGYPFLKDVELIIDYPNKKIAFLQEKQNN
ncbi:MAG: aspartyl protease family protein [Candidatus Thorarchaeota archaeon]